MGRDGYIICLSAYSLKIISRERYFDEKICLHLFNLIFVAVAFLPIVMTEENGGIKPQYVRRYWSCISSVPTYRDY